MPAVGVRHLLRHRANIERANTVVSPTGASHFEYSVAMTSVPCLLTQGRGRYRQEDYGQAPGRVYRILFAPEANVKQGDRVSLTFPAGLGTYRLTSVTTAVYVDMAFKECEAEQVVGEGE